MPRAYCSQSALNGLLRTPFAAPWPLEGATARHAYVSATTQRPIKRHLRPRRRDRIALRTPPLSHRWFYIQKKRLQLHFHSSVRACIQPSHREPALCQASRAMAGRPSLDAPIPQQAFWTTAGGREADFAPCCSNQRSVRTPAWNRTRTMAQKRAAKNVVQ